MVLQLVFREPAEILHATTTPVCPPPFSNCPNPRRLCVARLSDSYQPGLFSARSRSTCSSRGKLVSKVAASGRLSKPWERGSFVVSDGTLSGPAIYRASLVGDQATMKRRLGAVGGRSSVDSIRMLAVVQAWGREWMKLSCANERGVQTRDAVRDQSQQDKEMS
jgi:hypothetical protein